MGGSGGARGSGPPFLAHYGGFLKMGPKLDSLLDYPPPFSACRPKLPPPPFWKNPGSAPV